MSQKRGDIYEKRHVPEEAEPPSAKLSTHSTNSTPNMNQSSESIEAIIKPDGAEIRNKIVEAPNQGENSEEVRKQIHAELEEKLKSAQEQLSRLSQMEESRDASRGVNWTSSGESTSAMEKENMSVSSSKKRR